MYRRSFLGTMFAPLAIPYLKFIGVHQSTVCIARDCSGSITNEILDKIVQEAKLQEKLRQGKNFLYLTHDCKAQEVSRAEFMKEIEGGGTWIASLFQELESTLPLGAEFEVIYFTDGECTDFDSALCVSRACQLLKQKQVRHFVLHQTGSRVSTETKFFEVMAQGIPKENLTITRETEDERTYLPDRYGRNVIRSRQATSM